MKKILIISSIIITIIAISTIGYSIVSASNKLDEIEDIIEIQKNKESYLTPYGYTIDNPNVILNPYGNSPLTALILFETDEDIPVTIKIIGKDANTTYTNTFQSTNKHYIPIYGLYPNTTNNIELRCGSNIKNLTIKTEDIPKDLIKEENAYPLPNKLTFIKTNNYLYALDYNNDIRWYWKTSVNSDIFPLMNDNFLINTNSINDIEISNTILEIDLLGKIYIKYLIDYSPYTNYAETEESIFILNNNLKELDKTTHSIINNIYLEEEYNEVFYNKTNNTITLTNPNQNLEINLKDKKQTITSDAITKPNTLPNLLYKNDKEYKISIPVTIDLTTKTELSDKKIFLIGYKKTDKNYDKYSINIIKNKDNLKITSSLTEKDNAYLILDKFLDKKVYNLKGDITINKKGLTGKYSIYIKIKDTIYKTDNYINF